MVKNGLKCDVLVIGGGPAGLMAAVAASRAGAKTVVYERNNEFGIKLMMTGKGRCNLTHAEPDRRKFLEAYGRQGKFLMTAFGQFGPMETIRHFEERGVRTKVERGERVFPVSDQAEDVRGALLDELRAHKVELIKNARVAGLVRTGDRITGLRMETGSERIEFRNLIIATGGMSYPGSGSTGDGLVWGKELGHGVEEARPALTPVLLKEEWVSELEGLSLRNVSVSVYVGGKKRDERFGEALFTDRGLSGPVILDLSRDIGEWLKQSGVKLVVDYKPALEWGGLDLRVQKDFNENQNRMFKNSLDELLPQKLIPVVVKLSGIEPEKKVNLVTREERKRLLHLLKEMEFEVAGLFGFEKAIVTAGGVNLRQVDPRTMRSKLVENLYFAGEVLDLDAPTGGYNLQVAWSTGWLAGTAAAEALA